MSTDSSTAQRAPLAARWLLALALFSGAAGADEAGRIVLSVGSARLGDKAAAVGAAVHPGDEIATGADGYIYIKTVDNGFLILRPGSSASVVAYHVDADIPANTRIKIELKQGVARSISGEAVKRSRENFRFNTPVAAIGVRGTDFTVFTDPQVTRVAVISGGVVVAGFDGACGPEGAGPCEGASSRELFAAQRGQILEISRGQAIPLLLRGNGNSPDLNAPPRSDEPPRNASNPSINGANVGEPNLTPLKLANLDRAVPPAPQPQQAPSIVWGRWQALSEQQPATLDLPTATLQNQLHAINRYFALLRNTDSLWQPPTVGNVSFTLQGAEALVQIDGGREIVPASVENGKLAVDFGKGSFSTQFDLVTQGQRLPRTATGALGSNGSFSNPSQFLGNNNMVVNGVLANGQQGISAGYLFQSRLDDRRIASGATFWGK